MKNVYEEMLAFLNDNTEDGIICVRKNIIVQANKSAYEKLQMERLGRDVETVIGKYEWQQIEENLETEISLLETQFNVRRTVLSNGDIYIILREDSQKENVRALFENYNEDTLLICDKNGKITWTGKDVADNCGIDKEFIMEHTVYELENLKIFYPSVAVKALESGKTEIVTQRTATGRTGISIALPINDKNGNIEKVVTFTKNLDVALKLGDIMPKYNRDEQDIIFDELKLCSLDTNVVIEKIKALAKYNANFVIEGELGVGKKSLVDAIIKYRKIDEKNFYYIQCNELSKVKVQHELLGLGQKKGILDSVRNSVIYIDDISQLSFSTQKLLCDYWDENSRRNQIILGCHQNLSTILEQGNIDKHFYNLVSKIVIKIKPLRKRRIDIPAIVLKLQKNLNRKMGCEKVLSKDAIWALCCYDWPENIKELNDVLENTFLTHSEAYIDLLMLPNYIRKCVSDSNEETMGLLQIYTDKVEKLAIKDAMAEFSTISEAAEYLGVNQSTLSRKAHKYGLL